MRVQTRDHAVELDLTSAHARTVHVFESPTFGSGQLFVQLGSWHPEALALRIYETAPSLGWPRFTACVRVASRARSLRVTESRDAGTEHDCD